MNTILAHWSDILKILGALYALLNVVNGLVTNPEAKTWLGKLIDGIALVTRSGADGTFKAPMKLSRKKVAALLPFLALPLFVAGCACWKPEHRNDPVCAVVHQVIQCSESALTTGVASLVGQYINGVAEPNWNAVLDKLEQAGIKDGGCILAQLQNDFSGMMAAGPNGANAKAVAVNDLMGRWKIKHKLEGVRYQLKLADGRTVLR